MESLFVCCRQGSNPQRFSVYYNLNPILLTIILNTRQLIQAKRVFHLEIDFSVRLFLHEAKMYEAYINKRCSRENLCGMDRA